VEPRGYARIELELTQPLPDLLLPAGTEGMAVLVRVDGRPVGFWMEELKGQLRFSAGALARRVEQHVASDLLFALLSRQLPLLSAPTAATARATLTLSVVICTRDRPDWVRRCLCSLQSVLRSCPKEANVELLVVDNASTSNATRAVVAAFPGVHYHFEPVPGLDFARNRALHAASGELVAFLDDDVVVDSGWLEGLLEAWREHPDAGGFAGLVLPMELETPAQIWFERRGGFRRGFRRIRYRQGHEDDARFPLNAGKVGTGANMAFKRELVLALGGFDEALDTGPPLPGGGDLDMFYRVIREGHDLIYEPSYMVFHQHRRDAAALHRQLQSWGTGPMAMLSKIYAQEPAQRGNIHSLLAWWLGDQLRRLASSLIKRKLPTSLVLAELSGGVRGLFGEYERSRKRVKRRKAQHADSTPFGAG
jgi:glycosyltransferase involved in cell wall biosynthesis